jgi:hypothetical protein
VPIAGASASGYVVKILDEATTLTCTVTAANLLGAGPPATSDGVLVAISGTTGCPKPSGKISGAKLGRLSLGMTRTRARKALRRFAAKKSIDDFCLYGGWDIHAGYLSRKLLQSLPKHDRNALRARIVLLLTINPHYGLRGITPGASLGAAKRKLKLGKPIRLAGSDWYVVSGTKAAEILKVRRGIVQEVGIANASLTRGRSARRTFLSSFSSV